MYKKKAVTIRNNFYNTFQHVFKHIHYKLVLVVPSTYKFNSKRCTYDITLLVNLSHICSSMGLLPPLPFLLH